MRRGLFAAAVVALLAIAGCTQSSPPQPSGNQGSGSGGSGGSGSSGETGGTGHRASIRWHSCGGSGLRCATLRVPLNYANPSGRSITLALSEVPATAPPAQRLGIMLVNPGGPGGSGLSLASFVAQGLDPVVAARYAIIGFDTRGVGSSLPALHCDRGFFAHERPNYIPPRRTRPGASGSSAGCCRT